MTEFTDADILTFARQTANKLLGWTIWVEEAMEKADVPFGELDAPKDFFAHLDMMVEPCKECEVWHVPNQLTDGLCRGCRPPGSDD